MTLEAMKMEHALEAPFDGIVAELAASPDEQLMEGALILEIKEKEES